MAYGFDEGKNKVSVLTPLEILDMFYPVGTIYATKDMVFDPATKWGGKWKRTAAGRTLFGLATDDQDFKTTSIQGGEKNHVLTIGEMPKHRHKIKNIWEAGSGTGTKTTIEGYPATNKSGEYEIVSDYSGSGTAHNNMPPYEVVVYWLRTE